MENTGGLCGLFDKTEAQWWNESHVHTSYVTMQSICCQGDKSLVPVSQIVICEKEKKEEKKRYIIFIMSVVQIW